jgi:hypothetical protein
MLAGDEAPLAQDRRALEGVAKLADTQPDAVEHVIRDGLGQPTRGVAWAHDRIEADRVEIHDLIRVPGVSETGVESLEDGVAERPRRDGRKPSTSSWATSDSDGHVAFVEHLRSLHLEPSDHASSGLTLATPTT